MRYLNRTGLKKILGLAGLLFIFFAATGFSELFGKSPLQPIEMGPYLDRPATLIVAHSVTPVRSGTLVGAIINFKGQKLRGSSNNIVFQAPVPGTVRDVLESSFKPYLFTFYEVTDKSGITLGYLLAQDDMHAGGGTFFEEGIIHISAVQPALP